MKTRWRQWVVFLLMLFVGLAFGAPAYAQTYQANDDTQVYKPLENIDRGDIPPLHPLLDIYPVDEPDYGTSSQPESTTVLSAFTVESQAPITTVPSASHTADDKVYRLRRFATGSMLMLSGIFGLVCVRGKFVGLDEQVTGEA